MGDFKTKAAAAVAAAVAVAGCASGHAVASRPAWCSQAEHLNQALAEPEQVQNAILMMTAMSLPGDPSTFRALLAQQKTDWQKNHAVLNDSAHLAVTEGTAAAATLRRDCGY